MKIVVFGPESTGKTTLAQLLAAHYDTLWNPEFVREFLYAKAALGGISTVKATDLEAIAMGQWLTEKILTAQAQKLIFFDTNLLTHAIYAWELFGKKQAAPWLEKALAQWHYNHYLLTLPDIPWQADPQRDSPEVRDRFYGLMKQELIGRELPFTEIGGDRQQRLAKAVEVVDRLLALHDR